MREVWESFKQRLAQFFLWSLEEHPGKLIGTIVGILSGLLVVILGFWKALVLSMFVGFGFLIGKRFDEKKSLLSWLERFFDRY